MLRLLTCSQGHFWETADEEDAAPATACCPECGGAPESLPLLDLVTTEPAPRPAAPPPPLPLRDEKGRPVVAGYEILDDPGRSRGGVATYRARQTQVSRQVVLKVVHAREDPGQLAWGSLRGEAQALGKLQHPNVLGIHEAGERDRQLFYNAIEFVDGPTLAQLNAGKPLPLRQVLLLVETLARAVQHAHEKGIVHRSLKPDCVLLQPMVRTEAKKEKAAPAAPPFCEVHGGLFLPRITDWGLAHRPVEGDVNDAELQGEYPYYLSPEQAWGRVKEIGPATDVYALGAILFELLAGRPPFKESTPAQTVDTIQCREAPAPSRFRSGLPRDLDAICRRCLAKQPRRRYASALELASDLRRYLLGEPVRARAIGGGERVRRWLRRRAGSLALMLLGAAACWGILHLADQAAHTPSAPVRAASSLPQQLNQAQTRLQEEQRRVQQAQYFQRIALADRALETGDQEGALTHLAACRPPFRGWEWHYLYGRARGQRPLQFAMTDRQRAVTALAFHRLGQTLAACGSVAAADDQGGEVASWDLREGTRTWSLLHPRAVHGIAYSPSDFPLILLVDSGRGSEVRALAAGSGQLVWSQELPGVEVTGLAYTPDGSRLLLTDSTGRLRVWTASGAEVWTALPARNIFRDGSCARVAALNANDGSRYAAVTPDGSTLLLQTGGPGAAAVSHVEQADVILALAGNPATNRVATGSRDHMARLWAGGGATVLRGHQGPVTGVAFTADGSRLASCSADGTVKVWDPSSGLEILTVKGLPGAPAAVAFSPNGLRLAVGHGAAVTVWGEDLPQR